MGDKPNTPEGAASTGSQLPPAAPRPAASRPSGPAAPAVRPPAPRALTALPPAAAKKVAGLRVGLPKLDRPIPPKAALADLKPYWIGTLAALPFFSWTCPGGIRFVRNSGRQNERKVGQIVRLTEEQVEKMLKAVQQHVVRNATSFTGQARILCVDDKGYRVMSGDEPVGRYLYVYPLDPTNLHNRPTLNPQPLFDENAGE